MSSLVKSKVIRRQSIYGKSLIITGVVAMIMSLFASCESTNISSIKVSAPTSGEIAELSKKIKQLVKRLEYSEDVAQEFVNMVISWKDAREHPVLVVWEKKLNKVKEDHKLGRISIDRVAKVEESIAQELGLRIKTSIISGPDELFSLSDVIKHRQAQCLSYSQLFYILGDSIGLAVQTIHVVKLKTDASSEGHVAGITNLIDGRMMMVDLARNPTPMISKPFVLQSEFKRIGDYWELKEKDNHIGLHKRIRIFYDDVVNLLGAITAEKGSAYYKSGQSDKAVSMWTEAIELYPKHAVPYVNRGIVYRQSGQYAEAFSDFAKAIQLNPWSAKAYGNRALTYIELGKTDQGKKDLLKALELEPRYKADIRKKSEKYKLDLKLD